MIYYTYQTLKCTSCRKDSHVVNPKKKKIEQKTNNYENNGETSYMSII